MRKELQFAVQKRNKMQLRCYLIPFGHYLTWSKFLAAARSAGNKQVKLVHGVRPSAETLVLAAFGLASGLEGERCGAGVAIRKG